MNVSIRDLAFKSQANQEYSKYLNNSSSKITKIVITDSALAASYIISVVTILSQFFLFFFIVGLLAYVDFKITFYVIPTFGIIFLVFYNEKKVTEKKKILRGRSILELISQPRFLQALVSSSFAYAVMSFLMTATPISMHINDNMSLNSTSFVIQLHIISMFLPALVTGNLIKKFGHSKIMYCGVLFFIITIFLSYLDQTVTNYLFSLIFLGLGWNFLFISGTSLLVLNYREEERFRAQGFNDFIVFSIQATASLTAGIVLSFTSWKIMNILCIPFLIIIIFTTLRADRLLDKTN